MAEEVSSNLDKKLFELLLAISRCLDNMEEMLNTSVLSTEEAAVQQVLYEVTFPEHRGEEGTMVDFFCKKNVHGLTFFSRFSGISWE